MAHVSNSASSTRRFLFYADQGSSSSYPCGQPNLGMQTRRGRRMWFCCCFLKRKPFLKKLQNAEHDSHRQTQMVSFWVHKSQARIGYLIIRKENGSFFLPRYSDVGFCRIDVVAPPFEILQSQALVFLLSRSSDVRFCKIDVTSFEILKLEVFQFLALIF